ncbi:MAG: hypothetical protein ACR2OZ_19100 [Verrucomicrobiales bacterium]
MTEAGAVLAVLIVRRLIERLQQHEAHLPFFERRTDGQPRGE